MARHVGRVSEAQLSLSLGSWDASCGWLADADAVCVEVASLGEDLLGFAAARMLLAWLGLGLVCWVGLIDRKLIWEARWYTGRSICLQA